MLPLGGKPLFLHSVETALESDLVEQVCVSSDSIDILKLAEEYGAIGLRRPKELCGDQIPNFAVCQHAADRLRENKSSVEYIILLQPTTPFRTVEGLDQAIEAFMQKPAFDSLASVKRAHRLYGEINNGEWLSEQPLRGQRAQVKKPLYEMTGHLFILRVQRTIMQNTLLGKKIFAWPIPPSWIDIDIDEPFDLLMARSIVDHGYHIFINRKIEGNSI